MLPPDTHPPRSPCAETAATGEKTRTMLPRRTLGLRGLLGVVDRTLLETLDLGRTWHEVERPPKGVGGEIACVDAWAGFIA